MGIVAFDTTGSSGQATRIEKGLRWESCPDEGFFVDTKLGAETMELFDRTVAPGNPPDPISDFVQWLTKDSHQDDDADRRKHQRRRLIIPVIVQPIGEDYRPTDGFFQAITRDISTSDIGFICTQPIESQYVAIRLTQANKRQIDVAAEVLRCDELGAYYDVGCRFISKLNE